MRGSLEFRPHVGVESCGCVTERRWPSYQRLIPCEGHSDLKAAAERAFDGHLRIKRVEKVLWLRERLRKKKEGSS